MSSETDNPRQRTVAELLAEHGDTGATGRRRRRRAADEPEDGSPPDPGNGFGASAWQQAPVESTGRRRAVREAVREAPPQEVPRGRPPAYDRPPAEAPPHDTAPPAEAPLPAFPPVVAPPAQRRFPTAFGSPPARREEPVRERPTEQIPRVREAQPQMPDPALTAPIAHQRLDGPGAGERGARDDQDDAGSGADPDGGPATMIGAAPVGAGAWHAARTAGKRAEADGGPPTQAADPMDLDDLDDLRQRDDFGDLDDVDAHPAGLGREGLRDSGNSEGVETTGSRRRLERATESPGQVWAVVLMQWIGGAIGGAVLWVAFRFLWRSLPVVALAAAVLVTVGLVVVVRALLRNNDMRTTVFAVLVGLLLTVSPAILVLMGR